VSPELPELPELCPVIRLFPSPLFRVIPGYSRLFVETLDKSAPADTIAVSLEGLMSLGGFSRSIARLHRYVLMGRGLARLRQGYGEASPFRQS